MKYFDFSYILLFNLKKNINSKKTSIFSPARIPKTSLTFLFFFFIYAGWFSSLFKSRNVVESILFINLSNSQFGPQRQTNHSIINLKKISSFYRKSLYLIPQINQFSLTQNSITHNIIQINSEHLLDLRLFVKKCKRLAKNSETDEAASRLKAKNYVKAGNAELARVHAENAIRHRHVARYYHTLVANASPLEFELKKQLSGSVTEYTQAIIQKIDRLKIDANNLSTSKQEEVPALHINAFIQALSEDIQLDMLNKLPPCGSTVNSLEGRLDNLRR